MTQWGLDTLFNPAKRHMDEEKRRLQSTREEIGDSSGGKRIDLESGKVTISRSQPRDDDEDIELVDGAAAEPAYDEPADDGPANDGPANDGPADDVPADVQGVNAGPQDGPAAAAQREAT